MQFKQIITLLLILFVFVSCSTPSIEYREEITGVYFNPDSTELIINTSMFNNDSDYLINNDGSEGYLISMIETETEITFEFIADEHIEHLYLLQYKDTEAPFKELGTGHFIITKPKSNFKVPATGYYKFTVVRYYRN